MEPGGGRGLTVSAQHPSPPVATLGSPGRGLPWGPASLHFRSTAASRAVAGRVGKRARQPRGRDPGPRSWWPRERPRPERSGALGTARGARGKGGSAAEQRASAHCSPEAPPHQRGPLATRHRGHRGTQAGRPLRRTKAGPGDPGQLLPPQVGNEVVSLQTARSSPETCQPRGARGRSPPEPGGATHGGRSGAGRGRSPGRRHGPPHSRAVDARTPPEPPRVEQLSPRPRPPGGLGRQNRSPRAPTSRRSGPSSVTKFGAAGLTAWRGPAPPQPTLPGSCGGGGGANPCSQRMNGQRGALGTQRRGPTPRSPACRPRATSARGQSRGRLPGPNPRRAGGEEAAGPAADPHPARGRGRPGVLPQGLPGSAEAARARSSRARSGSASRRHRRRGPSPGHLRAACHRLVLRPRPPPAVRRAIPPPPAARPRAPHLGAMLCGRPSAQRLLHPPRRCAR